MIPQRSLIPTCRCPSPQAACGAGPAAAGAKPPAGLNPAVGAFTPSTAGSAGGSVLSAAVKASSFVPGAPTASILAYVLTAKVTLACELLRSLRGNLHAASDWL